MSSNTTILYDSRSNLKKVEENYWRIDMFMFDNNQSTSASVDIIKT